MNKESIYQQVRIPADLGQPGAIQDFLGQIEQLQSFDDINIASDRNIIIKSEGMVHRLTSRKIRKAEVFKLVAEFGKGSNAVTDVKGGRQLDDAYIFTFQEKKRYRYRINISAMRNESEQGLKIAMRSIKTDIPTLEYVGISEDEYNLLVNGPGLVIISGETGSGKTTTLAGVIGHLIRQSFITGDGRVICCYENPTEFLYQPLVDQVIEEHGDCSVEVYQHEIPIDFSSFIEATRNAFRSNPDIIVLGEARDYDTILAAFMFALSGHLVFITTHAKGVINTISRLITSFPESQRDAARMDFASSTKMIISQELIKTGQGGRVPLREKLPFTEDMRRNFARGDVSELPRKFVESLETKGTTFRKSADNLIERKKITPEVYTQLLHHI